MSTTDPRHKIITEILFQHGIGDQADTSLLTVVDEILAALPESKTLGYAMQCSDGARVWLGSRWLYDREDADRVKALNDVSHRRYTHKLVRIVAL